MKTIIIKNLSSIWDSGAALIVGEYLDHLRNPAIGYTAAFDESLKRFKVNAKIDDDVLQNKITFTITDAAPADE